MADTEVTAWILRPARRRDLAPVESLLRADHLPTDGVSAAFDRFIVAEADGQVCGVAGLETYGSFGLLRSVAVSPSLRGRGVGAALTEAVVAAAARGALTAVYLLTETARDFFLRHGFHVIDRDDVPSTIRGSAEFAELCPASSTVMVRHLERAP